MNQYILYDNTAGESKVTAGIVSAKRFIRDRLSLGHDAKGYKIGFNADGEVIIRGRIKLSHKKVGDGKK